MKVVSLDCLLLFIVLMTPQSSAVKNSEVQSSNPGVRLRITRDVTMGSVSPFLVGRREKGERTESQLLTGQGLNELTLAVTPAAVLWDSLIKTFTTAVH
ncbi:hypothetical protein RRG08_045850 [Elysia crispata]|uniref:Uncharacterized protein n=1 Tax=Elysia crispata TaxID=231223 RepID=A0AAE1B3X2_9GAST|nr:hypothetical protein RRG08_045850 [Elysia crispata]